MRPKLGVRDRVLRVCAAIVLPPLLLTACQSGPSSSPVAAPVAARMAVDTTSAQCIAQMQATAQRPGAGRIVLTAAAFATDDRLSIAPADTVLDAAGQPASGRTRGLPDSFRLTLNNGECTMVREADAHATPLTACRCVALHQALLN